MKNKTIYILRHGETDLNKQGLVQGRGIDASLNELGRKQANQAYQALKDKKIGHVFTSSMVRTHETAAPFITAGIPTTALAGFDEISWGKLEGVKATLEEKNHYSETLMKWRSGEVELAVGDGESPVDVMERQKVAMNEVLTCDDEVVLICMHGRALRVLISWLLGKHLKHMDDFPHQNCAYYALISDGEGFKLDIFNETSHLL